MGDRRKRQGKKRGRKPRNSTRMVSLGRSPIAKQALVRQRYCSNVTINPGTGVAAVHTFQANGLYDPDYTNSTEQHQPIGFDQWISFYNHYTVLGAKITVTCLNVVATIPIQFGILLRDNHIFSNSNPNTLKENGSSSWSYAGNINNTKRVTVSKNCSLKKFLGKKDLMDNDDCRGNSSANPLEGAYFQVWAAAADQVSDPASCHFAVTIDFISMYTEPKVLTQS